LPEPCRGQGVKGDERVMGDEGDEEVMGVE
jgi:hypothetical protein